MPFRSTLKPYEYFQWSVASIPQDIQIYKERANNTDESDPSAVYKRSLRLTIRGVLVRYNKFITYAKAHTNDLSSDEKQLYERLTKDNAFLRGIPDLETATTEDLERALIDIHKTYYVPRSLRASGDSVPEISLSPIPTALASPESNAAPLPSSTPLQHSPSHSPALTAHKAGRSSVSFPAVLGAGIAAVLLGVLLILFRSKNKKI